LEILIECPIELQELYKVILVDCMLTGANYYMDSVKIKAEAKIGKSWAEVK